MKIRYYTQEIEPSTIKELGGWRASLIIFLAALVGKIERAIEWQIMHLVSKRQGLAAEHIRALQSAFRQETLRREQREAISELIGPGIIQDSRGERYKYRGKTDYREARKDRTANFVAAYTTDGRANKYTNKKRLANPEGDVYEGDDSTKEIA